MIIGKSRIGISRLGVRSGFGEYNLELLTSASILERLTLSCLSNANIVNLFLLSLSSNADIDAYNRRQVLTNATILGTVDKTLLTNASIANRIDLSLLSNASIVITQLLQVLTGASILGPVDKSLLTNASISGPVDKTLLTNASIANLIALQLSTGASISAFMIPEIETNATIALLNAVTARTSAEIVDYHYWAVGPEENLIDLSGKVYDPRPKGFGLKTSEQRIRAGRRVELQDEGSEGGSYEFEVLFSSESEKAALLAAVNRDVENLRFHPGRSDRFFRVSKVSEEPGIDEPWRRVFSAKLTLLMEDPCLYHYFDQGLDFGANALPFTSTSMYNYGTVEAPVLFRIGGKYSGGQLSNPVVKTMNGSAEEKSLSLGPGLLSAEYAELTIDGAQKYYFIHTYEDDYSANDQWPYDAVQSGCSLSGGAVSVPALAWFYYVFRGSPLKENIKLLATIIKTGSPRIEYSLDGVTWYTAVSASEIVSGVLTEYYLTGTEKNSTVYVRFYSPAGSSMSVGDVDFYLQRDISSQYDKIPSIEPGQARTLKIEGSGSSQARIQTEFRSRWRP